MARGSWQRGDERKANSKEKRKKQINILKYEEKRRDYILHQNKKLKAKENRDETEKRERREKVKEEKRWR